MDIITNITNNLSLGVKNYSYICELDQLNLLNSLKKFPKIIFYILILILILYIIHFFYKPKDKDSLVYELVFGLPRLNFILTILATYIMFYLTFNITSELQKYVIDPIMYILCGCGIIYILWIDRDKIKRFILSLRE